MHLLQLLTIVAVHSLRLSSSLPPHVLQHARLPCSSLSPGVCSNSRPLSRWCHPIIPFTVTPFFSCPQSFNIDTLLVTDVQAAFRKGRGTRDQIANICWIIEKARVPEKHLFLLYWLCQSLWLCGSQSTVGNSERDGNTRPPDLPLEKPICRSRSNS